MKYTYIFCALIFFFISKVFALEWEEAKVIRTIDTEHALLADGKVIQFIGFDGPDTLFPTLKERGTARQTFHLLKTIFETQKIKILKDKADSWNNIFPRHIKLENGENLVELLLKNGLGTFRPQQPNTHFDKIFQSAETKAKENKIGIWDTPYFQKTNEYKRKIAGVMTRKWKKQYSNFLAPISVGRVVSVETGNKFTLEGGVCIRLLGVETPSPLDIKKGNQCFGKESRDFLSSLILGKKVEITQDISQLDDSYCILRHVWLPQGLDPMTPTKHINRIMIEEGFGKVSFPVVDKKFKESFSTLEENVYKNPRGAWINCVSEAIAPKKDPELSFDAKCPIKISKSGKAHTPKSSWYKRLSPVRCFENTESAREAGFEVSN